ncbi:hypothetical protein D4764_15G0005060 [Takifugu flavidus]|uniref:Uncharacterized protein n=1 Tax=Takifugu flavidus TaxID=433684 RepID=A0A5C6NZZ8_9TELE|nr:hypothetical protein D4764_15G0005060 [Takifugu flavidus]
MLQGAEGCCEGFCVSFSVAPPERVVSLLLGHHHRKHTAAAQEVILSVSSPQSHSGLLHLLIVCNRFSGCRTFQKTPVDPFNRPGLLASARSAASTQLLLSTFMGHKLRLLKTLKSGRAVDKEGKCFRSPDGSGSEYETAEEWADGGQGGGWVSPDDERSCTNQVPLKVSDGWEAGHEAAEQELWKSDEEKCSADEELARNTDNKGGAFDSDPTTEAQGGGAFDSDPFAEAQGGGAFDSDLLLKHREEVRLIQTLLLKQTVEWVPFTLPEPLTPLPTSSPPPLTPYMDPSMSPIPPSIPPSVLRMKLLSFVYTALMMKSLLSCCGISLLLFLTNNQKQAD